MSELFDDPAVGVDPFEGIYVHGQGPSGEHVYLSLSSALDNLPAAVAASVAGTWGKFARLVPKEAAVYREQMRASAAWPSWEEYRDAYLADGPPPVRRGEDDNDDDEHEDAAPAADRPAPTEAEIRAAWQALDWTRDREPLDSDGIDLGSLVMAGWDGRNSMYDPFRALEYDLPKPIADHFVHSFNDMDCGGPFYAFNDNVSDKTMRIAFSRLGCLVIEDVRLLSGYWDGIKDFATAQSIIEGYRRQAAELRNRLPAPALGARAWDDPHLFDDIEDGQADEEDECGDEGDGIFTGPARF